MLQVMSLADLVVYKHHDSPMYRFWFKESITLGLTVKYTLFVGIRFINSACECIIIRIIQSSAGKYQAVAMVKIMLNSTLFAKQIVC